DEYDIRHPAIFTESGRAMTAHHAVLVMNVIETEIIDTSLAETSTEADPVECVQALIRLLKGIQNHANVEQYHDAQYWYEQAQGLYNIGALSLQQRAQVEQLYFAVCRSLQGKLQHSSRVQRDVLDEINEKMADKYFCNFSVFQSIPDVWGIDQVFPVVPLHRLAEKPQRRGIIHDLTCDSDGHIEYYADNQGIEKTLPLHDVKADEDYWLGVFLVGAYQEILGDMHNLFGDTDAINVRLKSDGSHELVDEEYGDRIEELLSYVHFNVDDMLRAYREKIAASDLNKAEGDAIVRELEDGIKGYTYFEKA
ncbi:MAG: biosynthetic arginine decarboxylase, partial [Gammaproteobacteria bacterium]